MLTGHRAEDQDRRGRRRGLWLLIVLLTAVVVPLVVWQARPDGGGTPPAEGGRATASAPPASCPGPDLDGAEGWRKVVQPVYRAACARDYGALAPLLAGGSARDFTTDACSGCSAQDLVAMWRQEYGFDGPDLARLLSTRPVVDQGGLTYSAGGALAIFARGADGAPPQWSGFYPDCASDSDCQKLSELLRGTG